MNEQLRREDVEALSVEMQELKAVLREVSGKLGRIEKRLRVFFPDVFPKVRKEKKEDLRDLQPTISTQQALDLYSELVEMARSGLEQQVEARIANLHIGDLALLVRELGVSLGKKPNRNSLTKGLMGRLRESMMLARHTPRPISRDALSGEKAGAGGTQVAEKGSPVATDSDDEY